MATPHPINILTGDKTFRIEDYATADGALNLSRRYQSQPFLGLEGNFYDYPLALANWRFGFQYEVQIPKRFSTDGVVVLLTPDGEGLRFEKQSNGSLLPYTPSSRPLKQPDYKLEYLDTWPTYPWTLPYSKTHWRMTDAEDNVWLMETFLDGKSGEYHAARPTQMTAKSGLVLTFTYATDGTLTTLADSYGKSMSFTWSYSNGFPQEITQIGLPGGDKLKYTYDTGVYDTNPTDRLKKVELTDASNTVLDSTTYDYGNSTFAHAVTGVRDKNNTLRWSVTYDSSGRATESTAPGSAYSYQIAYGSPGSSFTRTVTNPLGKQGVYNFTRTNTSTYNIHMTGITGTASTHCPSSSTSTGYDSNHFVSSTVDEEGRTTLYTNDARGRPTQITEANGTGVARVTNVTWHSTFNVPTQIVEPKKTTDFTYDSQGRLSAKTETDTTSYTSPYSTNGRTRTWAYTWSTTGQLLTVDGPLSGAGDTVTYTYNTNGYLQTITNEVGQTTTVSSWNARGQPLTVVDPNSVSATLTYDDRGRPLTITRNPGGSQSQYQLEYDEVGDLTKITLPEGGTLEYTYDAAGRATLVTNNRGETETLANNAMGEVTAVTTKTSSNVTTLQATKTYDELGRLLQDVGASSETWTFAYDKVDNQVQVTDARSKVWGTTFDALNRAIVETDPQSHTVIKSFDGADQLTSHEDGRSLQTTRTVDGFGQVIKEVSPDRGTISYWYSAAGKLTKTVDGDGQETNFTYDNSGRLLTSTYVGASAEAIAYTYDATSGGNKGVGRLTSVAEESGSTAFKYDAQGRIIEDNKAIQGESYALGYAYDANGKLTQITLPSGRTVTYSRASDGLVTGISTKATSLSSSVTLASSVTYKPFGPLASLTYGNGLDLTRSYDGNYWLTRTEVKAIGATRLELSFGRNANGQLTSVTDNASSGRGASFAYTDAGRLSTAAGPWGDDAYAYDAAGNRTDKARTIASVTTHETPILSGSSNRVTSIQDGASATLRTLAYRSGGDLSQNANVGGPTYDYDYNARKRLVVAKKNGVDAGYYGYDFRGRRVWRTVFGTSTVQSHYIFDEDGHLLAEHDGATGDVVREYVWLDDIPIALIDSSSGTAQTYFLHTGQIDEPLVMTDSSKTKVWDAYVEPYGTAQVFGSPSAGLDLRLPGQWSEAETGGLSQNWFRNYDPSIGRYVEADPVGIDAGQNLYVYVDGDPLNSTDFSGLDINWIPGNLGAAASKAKTSGYNVFAHGSIGDIRDLNGNQVSAAQLAAAIRADPDWKRKPRTIYLGACLVGKYGFAQSLADEMGQTVITTSDYVFFRNGRPEAWRAYQDSNDVWHRVAPGSWRFVYPRR